jgi:hypothetical protein
VDLYGYDLLRQQPASRLPVVAWFPPGASNCSMRFSTGFYDVIIHRVQPCTVLLRNQLHRCTETSPKSAHACRRKASKHLLGFMWKEVPKLLFLGSQRLGLAATEFAGAVGAAILSCQGASLPGERQEPHNRKLQRGGRRSSAPVKRNTEVQSYPPFVLVQWCETLLAGAECSYTSGSVSQTERELVLLCFKAFLRHCGSELLPRASIQVVRSLLKLLDSANTEASYVIGLLDVLKEALPDCKPQELAQVLPDVLDVLLGWAVDPATEHSTRCAGNHNSSKLPVQ